MPLLLLGSTITTQVPLATNTTDSGTYGADDDGFGQGEHSALNGRPRREEMERFIQLQELLSEMDEEQGRALGYTKEDFILDCEYSGAFCYPRYGCLGVIVCILL